jgi:hypothetical protein
MTVIYRMPPLRAPRAPHGSLVGGYQLSFLVSAGIVFVTIGVMALPGRGPRGRVDQNVS